MERCSPRKTRNARKKRLEKYDTEKSVIRYKALCLTFIGKGVVVILRQFIKSAWKSNYLIVGYPLLHIKNWGFSIWDDMLKQIFILDFMCFESIIVELKALSLTTVAHKAQLLNYLKTTRMLLGLLVNFGCYPKPMVERIVLWKFFVPFVLFVDNA